MRARFISMCFIVMFGITSFSQEKSVEISFTNSVIPSVSQPISALVETPTSVDFFVSNISTVGNSFGVSRKLVDVPSSWQEQVCWGKNTSVFVGNCYTPVSSTNQNWVSPLSETVYLKSGEKGKMTVTIEPGDVVGQQGQFRYYITAEGSILDSVDLVFTAIAAVKEVKQEVGFSVSPNPASDQLLIQLLGIETASVRIVDVLGNVLLKESTINGSKRLDVSNFRNGVYFVIVESHGTKSITRKVIVKH